MSDHTLCDKCGKVIDKSEPYLQVVATTLAVTDGAPTVTAAAQTYDYHTNHAPKLEKAKVEETPEEPVEEEPPPEEAPE
jgi:hypothetical protein